MPNATTQRPATELGPELEHPLVQEMIPLMTRTTKEALNWLTHQRVPAGETTQRTAILNNALAADLFNQITREFMHDRCGPNSEFFRTVALIHRDAALLQHEEMGFKTISGMLTISPNLEPPIGVQLESARRSCQVMFRKGRALPDLATDEPTPDATHPFLKAWNHSMSDDTKQALHKYLRRPDAENGIRYRTLHHHDLAQAAGQSSMMRLLADACVLAAQWLQQQ